MADFESSRRAFMSATWGALMCAHFAATARQPAPPEAQPAAPQPTPDSRFARIKLRTHRLAEVQAFYSNTLGLPMLSASATSFVMQAGATAVEFEQVRDGSEPFYHFAVSIPENQFPTAKAWLAERTPLLRDNQNGQDEYFFENWNAHATYFHDPAGNIGEFIAHHTLSTAREGSFAIDNLLYVSEIGLTVTDQKAASQTICDQLGITRYQGSSFFVGDPHGFFVLPVVGRPWIPERTQRAAVHGADVVVRAAAGKSVEMPDLPYRIIGEA